jgi:signal transduction histidine kinase
MHLAIAPLRAAGGDPFGVVEVLFASRPGERQEALLEALVEHAGAVMAGLGARDELRRQVDTLRRTAGLAAGMLQARTVQAAVRAATRFCHVHVQGPVAAWWAKDAPGRLALLEARGLGARRRAQLREALGTLPVFEGLPDSDRARHVERFCRLTGIEDAAVLDAGSAVILVARGDSVRAETMAVVRSVLVEVIRNLERAHDAEQRNARLDLGLAWTAHEVRAPLSSVKSVLDLLLATSGPDQSLRGLLERSSRELHELSGQLEAMMRQAVGPRPLRRRPANLVEVARGAIESSELAAGQRRVVFSGPEQAPALIDESQLRSAIANLVRNAMAYSPPDSPVRVRVRVAGEHVIVSVADQGDGVGAGERDRIFAPFARGRGASARTPGAGLGLFMTRRAVEAHGGSVWAEPRPDGTTFHIALPRVPGSRGERAPSERGPAPS